MPDVAGLPAEFVRRMKGFLGDEWEPFLDSYLKGRYQALRFNPLKRGIWPELYPRLLANLQVERQVCVPWARDAFYYEGESCQPGRHYYHEMGLYYIQEPSAMSAAELLAPQPGERILDLCAAPGGKTTQIASVLAGQGLLVANEIHPARAKILSRNIERMGIANAIVTNEDSGKLAEYLGGFFHRILVDAPCSGEGMFRKNPDAALEWSEDGVKRCAVRQLEILENASHMLMPGGILVYSTCTFSPEENEQVIGTFLERHPEYAVVDLLDSKNNRDMLPPSVEPGLPASSYFEQGRPDWGNGNPALAKTFRLWPHRLHGEGHYAAVLGKAGVMPGVEVEKKSASDRRNPVMTMEQQAELADFAKSVLTAEMSDFLMAGRLMLVGEQLYRLPAELSQLYRFPAEQPHSRSKKKSSEKAKMAAFLPGLHVLRAGLHLGTFKKKRFEPSHALALFLGQADVKNPVGLSAQDPAAAAFFRGENIAGTASSAQNFQAESVLPANRGMAPPANGWRLVCVDGFSAGWGRQTGNTIKNHYPKGLRSSI